MSERLGDAPVQPEYRAKMEAVARTLDEFFNGPKKGADREVGFILLVFEYGNKEGRCNYISNGADRKDVATMLKEQVKRFEGQPEVKGHA
jgi:hypothetical protein